MYVLGSGSRIESKDNFLFVNIIKEYNKDDSYLDSGLLLGLKVDNQIEYKELKNNKILAYKDLPDSFFLDEVEFDLVDKESGRRFCSILSDDKGPFTNKNDTINLRINCSMLDTRSYINPNVKVKKDFPAEDEDSIVGEFHEVIGVGIFFNDFDTRYNPIEDAFENRIKQKNIEVRNLDQLEQGALDLIFSDRKIPDFFLKKGKLSEYDVLLLGYLTLDTLDISGTFRGAKFELSGNLRITIIDVRNLKIEGFNKFSHSLNVWKSHLGRDKKKISNEPYRLCL